MNESSSLYDPRTAPEDAGQDERLIDRFPVRLFEGSCQHALSIIHLNQRYMAQLVNSQQGEAAGELRQSLEDIQTAAARLDRDVTQMLCLLRCLQHSEKPRWELIDLCAFVQDLCLPRKMLGEALGVRLSLSCAGVQELYVQADRQYLTYICLALLSNALRACTPGGGKVTIALRQGDGAALLSITDNGCGLPGDSLRSIEENQDHFLGTSHSSLLLCREYCRLTGWTLELHDRPRGRGAEAVLTIPFRQADPFCPTLRSHSPDEPVRNARSLWFAMAFEFAALPGLESADFSMPPTLREI